MVGTRASCQPMPVLMIVAPASSIAWRGGIQGGSSSPVFEGACGARMSLAHLRESNNLAPIRAVLDQIEH